MGAREEEPRTVVQAVAIVPISKPPRSTGTSATSRKNKLQRCSRCGGLGHKSRTCDQSGPKASAGVLQALLNAGEANRECPSPRSSSKVAAASLLFLAEAAQ